MDDPHFQIADPAPASLAGAVCALARSNHFLDSHASVTALVWMTLIFKLLVHPRHFGRESPDTNETQRKIRKSHYTKSPLPHIRNPRPAVSARRAESYNAPMSATPSKSLPASQEFESLTQTAAETRRRAEGPNELPSSHRRGWVALALDVFREPMFLLLVACGALYFALGDGQEAAMLLGFVFFIMGITLFQEGKTERALEALRDLSSPRALVIRDGAQRRVAGRQRLALLVVGDRLPGTCGDRIHLALGRQARQGTDRDRDGDGQGSEHGSSRGPARL